MNSIIYHFKGLRIIFEQFSKGRFLLFFIPGTVVTLLFLWFQSYTATVEESIDLTTGISWIDWVGGWVDSGISKFFDLFDFIVEQMYIFIVITALSPFNTLLAEKLDNKLTGRTFKSNIVRLINDFIRMIFVVLIIIILESTFIIAWWTLSWLPFLDSLSPIVYQVIAAFFFGFSFYDFALERYQIRVFGSLGYAFSKPLTMTLTGGLFLLIYHIPYVGIPLAPVVAVMISTVVYLYQIKKLPISNNN